MLIPVCPYCNNPSVKVKGKAVYPHIPDLHNRNYWLCQPCKAWVGCHTDGLPFGSLANKYLRSARSEAHSCFDPVWKSGSMTRTAAYKWLAKEMGLHIKDCHIGMFDLDQCAKVVAICADIK